jgi:hypothetical protein
MSVLEKLDRWVDWISRWVAFVSAIAMWIVAGAIAITDYHPSQEAIEFWASMSFAFVCTQCARGRI